MLSAVQSEETSEDLLVLVSATQLAAISERYKEMIRKICKAGQRKHYIYTSNLPWLSAAQSEETSEEMSEDLLAPVLACLALCIIGMRQCFLFRFVGSKQYKHNTNSLNCSLT